MGGARCAADDLRTDRPSPALVVEIHTRRLHRLSGVSLDGLNLGVGGILVIKKMTIAPRSGSGPGREHMMVRWSALARSVMFGNTLY